MKVSSRMPSAVAALLVCLASSPSNAAEIWSGQTLIEHAYPEASGFNFMTKYSNPSLSNCDNGGRCSIAGTEPNYQATVDTLLIAFAAGEVNLSLTVNPMRCAGVVNRFIVKA